MDYYLSDKKLIRDFRKRLFGRQRTWWHYIFNTGLEEGTLWGCEAYRIHWRANVLVMLTLSHPLSLRYFFQYMGTVFLPTTRLLFLCCDTQNAHPDGHSI